MAAKEKKMINQLPAEAFLVRDESLKQFGAPFYKWLNEHGFRQAWHKGHYGCDWVFVNITHKLFAYGMPGYGIVQPIGDHAITLDEFYQIYGIYTKYEGLEMMCFSKEEQKERHTTRDYVRTPDAETRRILIETIEKDGYQIEDDGAATRQSIIESELPLMVNVTDKLFRTVNNADEAAELVRSGRIMDIDEFYVYYKGPGCSYEEYYSAVKNLFIRNSRYNEAEAESILQGEAEFLRRSYEKYIAGISGYTPRTVENYFFMQY